MNKNNLLGASSFVSLNEAMADVRAEAVAKAIAAVIGRKGRMDQKAIDSMWPDLMVEAKAAALACETDPTPESVARSIAMIIARDGVTEDGGFNTINKLGLIADTADQMWPSLLDEAKAAMKACGVG